MAAEEPEDRKVQGPEPVLHPTVKTGPKTELRWGSGSLPSEGRPEVLPEQVQAREPQEAVPVPEERPGRALLRQEEEQGHPERRRTVPGGIP